MLPQTVNKGYTTSVVSAAELAEHSTDQWGRGRLATFDLHPHARSLKKAGGRTSLQLTKEWREGEKDLKDFLLLVATCS